MKKRILYAAIIIVVGIALAIGLSATLSVSKYGIIKGKITDELSGDPIKGVRIRVDGKSTILYHSKYYQFTGIPPGKQNIEVFPPPGWVKFTKTIKVKPGENEVNISLKGDKIPDLTKIICFTESKKRGIIVEIRYVDSKGVGITEFPRLPVKIEVVLWERIGEEDNYVKGNKLFEGTIEHFWDSDAYLAKNKGILSWSEIPIKFEDKKRGIMEIRVHLEQGDFKDTVDDVSLFPEEEEE